MRRDFRWCLILFQIFRITWGNTKGIGFLGKFGRTLPTAKIPRPRWGRGGSRRQKTDCKLAIYEVSPDDGEGAADIRICWYSSASLQNIAENKNLTLKIKNSKLACWRGGRVFVGYKYNAPTERDLVVVEIIRRLFPEGNIAFRTRQSEFKTIISAAP